MIHTGDVVTVELGSAPPVITTQIQSANATEDAWQDRATDAVGINHTGIVPCVWHGFAYSV
jgi:hypothetical protein